MPRSMSTLPRRGAKESPDLLALRSDASMTSSAEPWGPEFQVTTFTASGQSLAIAGDRCVAMNLAGETIVVWTSWSQDGSD